MENAVLIKICIISAILGISLLIIINEELETTQTQINSLSEKDINKRVKVEGIIKEVENKDKITFLEIEDKTGKIKTIIFKPNSVILKRGTVVEVEGKVSLNNNKFQIYAETIKEKY